MVQIPKLTTKISQIPRFKTALSRNNQVPEPKERIDVSIPKVTPAVALAGGFGGVAEPSPFLKQFTPQEKSDTDNLQVLKAAFETENVVGSTIAKIKNNEFIFSDFEPEFDVIPQIQNTKYEPYLDSFLKANNDNDVNKIKSQIDREEQSRDVLSSAGGTGIAASMIAGVFDPINLIPIGGTAFKAFSIGSKTVKAATTTATAAGLSSIASEAILQSQQVTRTLEESAINIGGSVILGGLIGAAASKLSTKQYNTLAIKISKDIQRKESEINIDTDGNLSAAKSPTTTLDQETLAGGKITQAVIASTKKLNPMLRVLTSQSKEARKIVQNLVRTNMYFKKNAEDIASDQSVEIAIKSYDAGLGKGVINNRDLFKKLNSQDLKSRLKARFGIGLKQFNDDVSLAMIRNDTSQIPEVAQAAKVFRSEVFDPLKDQAIEQGLLPKGVKPETAPTYMMRQYNTRKIVAQEPEFRRIIETGARERLIPQIRNSLKKTEENISSKKLEKLKLERQGVDTKIKTAKDTELDKLRDRSIELDILVGDEGAINAYVEEITDSVINNIRGIENKGVTMPYDMKIGVRGPAKERVLTFVTDEELRPFLETDIEKLAKNYTRVLSADVEIKRRFGDLNLTKEQQAITDEYTALRKQTKTEKERKKLDNEEKEVKDIVNAFKDMIRGNYGRPNDPDSFWPRASKISRMIQYMSKLGGVTVSSISDTGRHVMVHGYNRVFNKGIKNIITNLKGVKLSIKDARQAGNILETVTHQRAALMADVGDPYASGTQFERTLSWMSDNFSKVNLLDYWNNYQKGFASIITQQRLIENINNFGKIKPKESRYMALLGVDSNNVRIIKQQLDKHSFKDKDLFIANLKEWDNVEAARIYKNALNTDVDRTIVTKGVGDIPLLMNTELGKTIFQFKSFSFAAHQQVTIAGLQQGDAAALSGMATMVSMGMLTYYLKQLGAEREVSDDPIVWLTEGVDRSGIIPIIAEINGVADVFGFGAGTLTGQQPLSRFMTRNKVGGLLGPSFGGVVDLATFTRGVASGEIKESDIRALRKNLAYQNIFYLRNILNEFEESLTK